MSTFAGDYIKEPSDLAVVCTEGQLIALCDDIGGAEATGAVVFADLSGEQVDAIAAIVNEQVHAVERTINGYASRQGYATPLNPVDADVKSIAARLVWVGLRQRGGGLTGDAAEEQRRVIRNGELRDIADGRLVLTAQKTGVTARAAHVYRLSDARSRDVTGSTVRLSRQTLRDC